MASTLAHSIFSSSTTTLEKSVINSDNKMKIDSKYDSEGDSTVKVTVDLLQRLTKKDSKALAELYDAHAGLLMSVIMSILKDKSEAEDILQESFIAIYNKADMYNSHLGKPMSWMATVARNKAYDRYRKLVRQSEGMVGLKREFETCHNASDSSLQTENEELLAGFNSLNKDQRAAIELVFYEGLTHMEAAEKLKAPLGTVKARIRRGLLKLKQTIATK